VLDAQKTQHKIRLAGIDAPESRQAFGQRAKQHLIALSAQKQILVVSDKLDRNRRIVGKLTHNGTDLNLSMVTDGFAWWYREYADEQSPEDQKLYENAETDAKAERRGLWIDPNPMPPWEWRRRPEPPGGYAAACPCGSGEVCTGKRGGRFCVRSSGTKRYLPKGE